MRMMTRGFTAILVVLLIVLDGQSQVVAHRFTGGALDRMGVAVNGIGDVDGDGLGDFAYSSLRADFGGTDSGRIYARSGATGGLLWTFDGPQAGALVGEYIAGGEDANGDGVPDVVVTSSQMVTATGLGSWFLLSGPDGSVLRSGGRSSSATAFGYFGAGASMIRDVDGDSLGDFVLANQTHTQCISGGTGATIWTTQVTTMDVAAAGDQNGDGVPDFFSADNITARLQSGADGLIIRNLGGGASQAVAWMPDTDQDGLRECLGAAFAEPRVIASGSGSVLVGQWNSVCLSFGLSVARCGDLDGDGVHDFAGGLPYAFQSRGAVGFFSGADGRYLRSLEGASSGEFFGTMLNTVDDLDGDGQPEVIMGMFSAGSGAGEVRVFASSLFTTSGIASSVRLGSDGGCATSNLADLALAPTDPRLGRPYTVNVRSGQGAGTQGLLAFDTGMPVPFPVLGSELYLDLARATNWAQIPFATNTAGSWSLGFSISNDPGLVGASLIAQVGLDTNPFILSNGLYLVLGN